MFYNKFKYISNGIQNNFIISPHQQPVFNMVEYFSNFSLNARKM